MQAIVIKYIQLFCVAVLFDNVSCDQIMLKNYKDDQLFYQTTSCTAFCLKNYANKTLKECYERVCETRQFNETEPTRRNSANFKIKLICRDDTSLVVEIVDDSDTDYAYGNHSSKYPRKKREKGNLYMVKVERGNVLSEKIFYITESPLIQIKNLTSSATYNITATVMHPNYEYTNAVKMGPIQTLAKGYEPRNVELEVPKNFRISDTSNNTFDTFISWEPADDRTCHYNIFWYDRLGKDGEIVTEVINKPELLYQYPIRNLPFGSYYSYGIEAVNTFGDRKSKQSWINVTAPTCWEWYPNDTYFETCPPYPPTNITVSASFVSRNVYQMNVSWDKPQRQPTSYLVVITDDYIKTERKVPGGNTYEFFENVEILHDDYEVAVTAISSGGNNSLSAFPRLHGVLTEETDKNQSLRIMLYIGSSVVGVILMGILIATIFHLKARSRRRRYREEYFEGLDKHPHSAEIKNEDKRTLLEEEIKKSFLNDGMEIDEDDIDIRDIIGEGAFGFVSRGILLPTGKEVAVKRLKDVVTFDVMQSFCQEVEVMRSVDKHPNIVGIIGHCMKDIEKMMILTEYCSEGNLLDFLRNYWQRLMKCSSARAPLTNATIAEDWSFRKPIESEFNFGSSIPEKNLVKQKNIHNVDDSIPLCIKNLIINKLYDECSDNFDSKPFFLEECNNSCKSYVDIIEEGYNDKVRISVKDCDCRENEKNKMLNYLDRRNSIVENPGYDEECKINKISYRPLSERSLTRKDLLSFALQIATGMEFLSFNKVVHRDLAARNVCVCYDYTVKIADFGLSRDIYQENMYKKETEGKLPIKWLALESMTFQMYTSQSDVWSYGILLYEIVTLGSTPYPSIQTGNLLKLLMSGYRMEKPPNCDDNIYELMLSCWRTVPSERPTFTEIKSKLERLLTEFKDNQPMHNKMFDNNLRSISSSGSYLKPI